MRETQFVDPHHLDTRFRGIDIPYCFSYLDLLLQFLLNLLQTAECLIIRSFHERSPENSILDSCEQFNQAYVQVEHSEDSQ